MKHFKARKPRWAILRQYDWGESLATVNGYVVTFCTRDVARGARIRPGDKVVKVKIKYEVM